MYVPTLATMTPANRRLTEMRDTGLGANPGSEDVALIKAGISVVKAISRRLPSGARVGNGLLSNNLALMSANGETVRSKGLPGVNTEITHKTREDSWAIPEMMPVRINPHLLRSQVKAIVPRIPVKAEAPINKLKVEPLNP